MFILHYQYVNGEKMNKVSFEGEGISPDRLPQPSGWRLLIGMLKIEKQTESGIVLPDEHVKGKNYLRNVAKVLAVGDYSYKEPRFQSGIPLDVREPVPWVKVGDIILIRQYEGQDVVCLDGDEPQTLRVMNDDEVLTVIPDISILSL